MALMDLMTEVGTNEVFDELLEKVRAVLEASEYSTPRSVNIDLFEKDSPITDRLHLDGCSTVYLMRYIWLWN